MPEVTFLFWIIKIAATTLGETAGDAVSMSLNLGYIVSTGIFAFIFAFSSPLKLKLKHIMHFFIGRPLLQQLHWVPQSLIMLIVRLG